MPVHKSKKAKSKKSSKKTTWRVGTQKADIVPRTIATNAIAVRNGRASHFSTVIRQELPAWQHIGNTGSAFAQQIQPGSVPILASYSQVFQQFRVKKVVIYINPTANFTSMGQAMEPTGGANTCYFNSNYYTAIDYVNTSPPASSNAISSYETCIRKSNTQRSVRTIYPMISTAVVNPGMTSITGRATVKAGDTWFDIEAPNYTFGSLLFYADPVSNTAQDAVPYQYVLWAEWHFDFRGTR